MIGKVGVGKVYVVCVEYVYGGGKGIVYLGWID